MKWHWSLLFTYIYRWLSDNPETRICVNFIWKFAVINADDTPDPGTEIHNKQLAAFE